MFIPKWLKITVSIIIAVSFAVNPIISAFDVRAEAFDPFTIAFLQEVGTWVVTGIVSWIGGTLIGSAASDLDQTYHSYLMTHYEEIQAPTLQGGCPVSFQCRYADTELEFKREQGYYTDSEWPVMAYLDESVTLTAEQRDFYEYFCTVFNSADIIATSGYLSGYVPSLSVEDYNKIKNEVSNYFLQQASKDLQEAVGVPTYSFNFVGPLPSLNLPSVTSQNVLFREGFSYTVPFDIFTELTVSNSIYYYFPSKELAESAGANHTSLFKKVDSVEYWNGIYNVDCYGGGFYILYNGECYYYCQVTYGTIPMSRSFLMSGWTKESFIYYVNCDGVKLSDVYNGGGFSFGVVVNLTGEKPQGVPSDPVFTDDFESTSGGAVSVPRTDSEDTVGDALLAGLINDDSRITLDENGNITTVDGITLAKIDELIDLIGTGNLAFEDVQQYLDLITTLITNGNWTASEQLIIMGNLQSLIDSQSLNISEINTAVQTIAQSITAEGELESVKTDFSTLIVEHHGLSEAELLVNKALPVVSQCKELVTNVFNQAEKAPDYRPNFSFYWDSNKDGVVEQYTALDLSFMEYNLTNANLDDKNRFKDPMTVREFVQSLIVFFAYALFFIKLLRRLPGLFGGAESHSDDVTAVGVARSKC